jgi:hypothetical protein
MFLAPQTIDPKSGKVVWIFPANELCIANILDECFNILFASFAFKALCHSLFIGRSNVSASLPMVFQRLSELAIPGTAKRTLAPIIMKLVNEWIESLCNFLFRNARSSFVLPHIDAHD